MFGLALPENSQLNLSLQTELRLHANGRTSTLTRQPIRGVKCAMQAERRAAEDGLKPVPHELRGCDWLRCCPTLQSHYDPFVVTRLCQSAAEAASPEDGR